MEMKLFVNEIKVSYLGTNECIQEPNMKFILDTVDQIKSNKVHYIELNNTKKSLGMVVFSEPNLYQIGIVNEDNDDIYYYCNGMDETDEFVSIYGNYFSKHLICNDFDILKKIIEKFCYKGERLGDVKWIYEEG